MALFASSTNYHYWRSNQFRLLLSSQTCVLTIHRVVLQSTDLAHVTISTLNSKLIKIGAVILRNNHRTRLPPTSKRPYRIVFFYITARLVLRYRISRLLRIFLPDESPWAGKSHLFYKT
ncbi:transposase [Nitrosomonas aestuarii]|uniref:transposase n=1 Tax=Nitrosomonas aestuarii TaxID=52441 RepID=UPI000B876418